MVDLTKCHGTNCLRRESCVRYTHPPREKYQSYLVEDVAIPDVEKCRFFSVDIDGISGK